ncbi:hypothetical protein FDF74_10200 [Clostridium niameyense]|uniref:Uncharacterized protein n=1 Tax=Clostridium niameyense TaxID=1622073 RepID=A0A6M0RB88_9CLOT|nr:hypothetical protein [Clostridium niameyense]NEZ47561.1 hypothetical protein [Clostridium niameyense]
MSKCKCRCKRRKRRSGNGLIILILILLQFGGCCRCSGQNQSFCGVDNSILFIIALYYLSCCGDFLLY